MREKKKCTASESALSETDVRVRTRKSQKSSFYAEKNTIVYRKKTRLYTEKTRFFAEKRDFVTEIFAKHFPDAKTRFSTFHNRENMLKADRGAKSENALLDKGA